MQTSDAGTIKVCAFCGEPLAGKRANEHVIPKWLLKHLEISKRDLLHNFRRSPRGQIAVSNCYAFNGFVQGSVCEHCNCGWMSRLETRIGPVVQQLIRGETGPEGLNESEAKHFSLWAVKTAYALAKSGPYSTLVPAEHLAQCRMGKIPLNVVVLTGKPEADLPALFEVGSNWPAMLPDKHDYTADFIRINTLKSYKIIFQFGRLLFQVAYWSVPEWSYGIVPSIHHLLSDGGAKVQTVRPIPNIVVPDHQEMAYFIDFGMHLYTIEPQCDVDEPVKRGFMVEA